MSGFTVNAGRLDPYKDYKFRVRWDGRAVAGVSRVGPLRRTTEALAHRDGGDLSAPRLSPGLTRFDPVRLERGVTHDPAFEDWADRVWRLGASPGAEVALRDFRKDVVLELMNEAGQVALAYRLFRCWPSEHVALPALDALAPGGVAFEAITLQTEGWARDREVAEPSEPGAER